MKSKILVFGFACLSVVAVAQSNEKQSKEKQNQPPAAVKSPRDIATGQASGRAMSDQKVVHRDLARVTRKVARPQARRWRRMIGISSGSRLETRMVTARPT